MVSYMCWQLGVYTCEYVYLVLGNRPVHVTKRVLVAGGYALVIDDCNVLI